MRILRRLKSGCRSWAHKLRRAIPGKQALAGQHRGRRSALAAVIAILVLAVLVIFEVASTSFSRFTASHPLTTTLLGAFVFAVITALVIDRTLESRKRKTRSLITASEVKASADLLWRTVSDGAFFADNLMNLEVVMDAQRLLHEYRQFIVLLAQDQVADSRMRSLIQEHLKAMALLEAFVQEPTGKDEEGVWLSRRVIEQQEHVDRLSWPHYRSLVPAGYWASDSRHTYSPHELPPQYGRLVSLRRASPDPDVETESNASRREPDPSGQRLATYTFDNFDELF